jgi:hypothetical protein
MKIIKVKNCNYCPYRTWHEVPFPPTCEHPKTSHRQLTTGFPTLPDWCPLDEEENTCSQS